MIELNAKSRLLATEEPIDGVDVASRAVAWNAGTNNPPLAAGVDDDSVEALEEKLAQAQSVVDETKRALELHAMRTLLANDTSDFETLPVSNISDMTEEKAEAMAPDAIDEDTQLMYPAGDDSGNEDVTKVINAGGLDHASGIGDEVSNGDAFDMLIDGDPSEEEPIVQELTNSDGGVEAPADQSLLRDDVSNGLPTI